jgi:hypothetical protein
VPDAETFTRDAIDRALSEQNPDAQASAYEMLAQVYLAGKKIPEARDAIAHALAISNPTFGTKLETRITAARVEESRSRTDAIARLRSIVWEAAARSHVLMAFEARLPLGEMELRAGQREVGRAHLASLKTDAGARGFALIARKAQAALDANSSAER